MAYSQITDVERYMISAYRKQGWSVRATAKALGRSPSSISRELRRNASSCGRKYRPSKAVEKTNGRRSHSRRNSQFTKGDWKLVIELLRQDLSPEQISGKLRKSGQLRISHETIYRYVWRDKRSGGCLHAHLRGSQKLRRKRHNSYDSRGRLAGKRPITERPASAENRTRVGHWEIDTVMGKGSRHCIVTLVERKTGFVLIGKLRARSTAETNKRVLGLTRRHPQRFKTITSDHGTEFHGYKELENRTGVRFYFATPYHSWERGTSENTNGLIRQYLPKGMDMKNVTQARCNAIARRLNTRPRKRLGYRTPEEVFHGG